MLVRDMHELERRVPSIIQGVPAFGLLNRIKADQDPPPTHTQLYYQHTSIPHIFNSPLSVLYILVIS